VAPRRTDPTDCLPLPNDALFIMLALAAEPQHGYGIIRDVEARSDGQVILQTGALYRMLRRLLRDDCIVDCARPAGVESEDDRRRYYALTPFGRQVLDAEVARMSRLVRAARLTSSGRKPRLN